MIINVPKNDPCYLYSIKIDSSLATGANQPKGAEENSLRGNALPSDVYWASVGREVAVPRGDNGGQDSRGTSWNNPAAYCSNHIPHRLRETKEFAGSSSRGARCANLDFQLQILFSK